VSHKKLNHFAGFLGNTRNSHPFSAGQMSLDQLLGWNPLRPKELAKDIAGWFALGCCDISSIALENRE